MVTQTTHIHVCVYTNQSVGRAVTQTILIHVCVYTNQSVGRAATRSIHRVQYGGMPTNTPPTPLFNPTWATPLFNPITRRTPSLWRAAFWRAPRPARSPTMPLCAVAGRRIRLCGRASQSCARPSPPSSATRLTTPVFGRAQRRRRQPPARGEGVGATATSQSLRPRRRTNRLRLVPRRPHSRTMRTRTHVRRVEQSDGDPTCASSRLAPWLSNTNNAWGLVGALLVAETDISITSSETTKRTPKRH
jgi:hypothetical protein